MALSEILNVDLDVRPFFGSDACDEHDALLRQIKKFTESQARRYVGHGIIEATYTNEYQRRFGAGSWDSQAIVDVVGGKVYTGPAYNVPEGHVLQLDNGIVRSVTSVREDTSARFNSSGGFAAATELTEGTDFDIEMNNDDFSVSGRLIRRNRNWSSIPGTIRVTYVAGLSSAELSDKYLFVKLALLEDMREKFDYQLEKRASSGYAGPVRRESYSGDYSVEYATSTRSGSSPMSELSEHARGKLQSIRRMAL